MNLAASPAPEGNILNVSWEAGGGSVAGYNLYRSTISGGPYSKVNGLLINGNSYIDQNLANKTTYYYVATGVDALSNESAYSNEAVGVPGDTLAPSQPNIFFPTLPDMPMTVYSGNISVAGTGDPGANIALYRNGTLVARTKAAENDSIKSEPLQHDAHSASLSPSGKTLAFTKDFSIWLRDLKTGSESQLIDNANSPVWSPDSGKIAFTRGTPLGNRISIYDLNTGSTVSLTDTNYYANESNLTWSQDGKLVSFTSAWDWTKMVWVKNLNSGELRLISNYAFYQKMSLDGSKVAYFEDQTLYIQDLATGSNSSVDANTDWRSVAWSRDSRKIAFVSYKNGSPQIFAYDLNTGTDASVLNLGWNNYVYSLAWSFDGSSLFYESRNSNNYTSSAMVVPVGTGQPVILTSNLEYLISFEVSQSGILAFTTSDALYLATLAGRFELGDVALDSGENTLHATAVDNEGNSSAPSAPTVVFFDTGLLPDPEITESDVFIYPEYPLIGQDIAVNAVVWNRGSSEVKDVDVDLYLWDSSGNVRLLKTQKIPSIAAGDGAIVDAVWNSGTNPGVSTIIAVIDSEDKIEEISESNNTATKEITVVSDESVVLATSLDASSYKAGQDVNIKVTLKNPGMEKAVSVEASIEDESGYPVTVFDPKTVTLTYGSNYSYDLAWNTGSTYAGTYKVHAVLKDSAGIVDEKIVSFTILPDISISAALSTNKANYGTMENVALSSTVKSIGQNYIIPALRTKMTLTDPSGAVIFSEEKETGKLLPGASVTLNAVWNSGTSQAGTYTAGLEVYREQTLVATKSAQFNIGAVVIINGELTATPSAVSFRNEVKADYRLSNSGNSDATELTVQLLVVDPETGDIKTTVRREGVEVRKGEAVAYTAPISTEGLSIKTYKLVLQYSDSSVTKTIGTTSFTVKDMLAPVVSIQSPVSGTTYNEVMPISVTVTDDATGVDRVEYRIDAGTWKLLAPSDPSSGRYSTIWEPTMSDNGPHTLDVRATDKAGNTSEPVPVSFEIQLDNVPPVTGITVGEPKYESIGTLTIASATPFTLSAADNFSRRGKDRVSDR